MWLTLVVAGVIDRSHLRNRLYRHVPPYQGVYGGKRVCGEIQRQVWRSTEGSGRATYVLFIHSYLRFIQFQRRTRAFNKVPGLRVNSLALSSTTVRPISSHLDRNPCDCTTGLSERLICIGYYYRRSSVIFLARVVTQDSFEFQDVINDMSDIT